MFKLPCEVKEGIKNYKSALNDLTGGKTTSSRFTGMRVPWGIYSHRGGESFMVRIRIPGGRIGSGQLRAVALVARTFADGVAHITTRQDIQIHGVKIGDTIKVIEYLKDFDLSPRGGGGNTVRNVTACAFSGICKDEVFSVGPYAVSLTEHFLSEEASFNLPRKFKLSFSGCRKDCAGVLINDMGFLAQVKGGEKGFKVFVGGGMGAESALGHLLEEFIPERQLGYCAAAVKNIFYKKGDRRNKHHNRLRFLIKDIGIDVFKGLYLEELKSLQGAEHIALRNIEVPVLDIQDSEIPCKEDKDFEEFLKFNIRQQSQKGLVSVELRIPRGDISAEKLDGLAALEEEFSGISFCTSSNQNIHISDVSKSDAYKLFLKIKKMFADFLYPSTLLDIVCCKGALTCNLGLCNSPGLTERLEELIKNKFIDNGVFQKLNIRINGCPNACGQHPVGLIALHGVARRVNGRPVPFYKLLLGGRKAAGDTRLAKDTGIILPARNIPLFLEDFIARVTRDAGQSPDIYKYIDECSQAVAVEIAEKYSHVPFYSENREFYIDWGKKEEFSLDSLGPGECGAGVMDMIAADLSDAGNYLEEAEKKGYSTESMRKALFFSSRSLLVVKGTEPKDEKESLRSFVEEFIKAGVADSRFANLTEIYDGMNESLEPRERKVGFSYAKDFLAHVSELYKNMDPSFNFSKRSVASVGENTGPEQGGKTLDLKGVRCPMNYVRAKLYLEGLDAGEIVYIYLDEGEPIQNVPVSLKNDGQEVMEIKKLDSCYKIKVKKLL